MLRLNISIDVFKLDTGSAAVSRSTCKYTKFLSDTVLNSPDFSPDFKGYLKGKRKNITYSMLEKI